MRTPDTSAHPTARATRAYAHERISHYTHANYFSADSRALRPALAAAAMSAWDDSGARAVGDTEEDTRSLESSSLLSSGSRWLPPLHKMN